MDGLEAGKNQKGKEGYYTPDPEDAGKENDTGTSSVPSLTPLEVFSFGVLSTNPNGPDGKAEDDRLPAHVDLDDSVASLEYSTSTPVKLEETRNVELTASDGDFILEDDRNREMQGILMELFRDLILPYDRSSVEPEPASVCSHAATSTKNLSEGRDCATGSTLGKWDGHNDELLSLYSESADGKLSDGSQEIIVYAQENGPRGRLPHGRKVLFVESKKSEDDIWEKYEFHWRALEKRIRRNNYDALEILKKIQSAPNSKAALDDFEARERFYRRKHLVSWQAAISMPRTKKIPFETQIPLAATTHLRKRLPKWESFRRRSIKIFACGSSRYYLNEVLTQVSVDNFNAKYNAMKASIVLPGYGLQKRMQLFTMRHPKMIEQDEIMSYSYGDYIKDSQKHPDYFKHGGSSSD